VSPLELARLAKAKAAQLGFDACGITDLAPSRHAAALRDWLAAGWHGDMAYMSRQARQRQRPAEAWGPARSVVVVLHNYFTARSAATPSYRVSRYAQDVDYHRVIGEKLRRLGVAITTASGTGAFRAYVDSGPLPERELASRAGLGWLAKNTMLIHPRLGSFTFIGCLLTNLALARDEPFEADRCGSCSRCLEACPTDAFPAPHVLDATRCVSYLTIEARADVPEHLRAGVGDNLFGCDICQDVCPWNVRFARETGEARYRPRPASQWPTLEEILRMSEDEFDRRFGDSAIERAQLAGFQRNARVVLENQRRGLPTDGLGR
jgi:epoxyqueuosine reductase